jgi:UDP-N-acetylmuramoyl-L-alanyl-D-glutamate--2,6-diaminopimelate ligase
MTTPDCWTLHQALAQMREDGVELVCMEVSSHALAQQRTAGLDFEVAVWTNLSQDHLDYHQDMEAYFQAKARLFTPGKPSLRHRVINIDDAYGHRLYARCKGLAYSLEAEPAGQRQAGGALLRGQVRACTRKGLELTMELDGQTWELQSGLVGRYNAANLLAAQGAGLCLGLRPKDLAVLRGFAGVPGRLERVGNRHELDIFVDYAHTPDALENVLSTLRALCRQRLIVVFGCGGDRDRSKRALMGQAVCRWADMAVLTSDNPRHEKPEAIMEDVRPGLAECPRVISDPDRRQAIGLALEWMRPGDVLLVAGKGHESTQQTGDTTISFHDPTVIRELLCQKWPQSWPGERLGGHGCA